LNTPSPASLPYPFDRVLAAANKPGVDALVRGWLRVLLTEGKQGNSEDAAPKPAERDAA
jgi:hypothetical protein